MTAKAYDGEAYATETLVTDTVSYDVVGSTPKTIKIRRRRHVLPGRRDENVDQGPYPPVMWFATESDERHSTITLRLRKDGTYRRADWARPLRFTNEPPEIRVDYRM